MVAGYGVNHFGYRVEGLPNERLPFGGSLSFANGEQPQLSHDFLHSLPVSLELPAVVALLDLDMFGVALVLYLHQEEAIGLTDTEVGVEVVKAVAPVTSKFVAEQAPTLFLGSLRHKHPIPFL
jgi:hypothetical protein